MGLNLDLFKPIKQIYFSRTCLTHKKIVKIAQNFGSDGHFEMMCLTSLMPCPFTGPKMFCASPNFLTPLMPSPSVYSKSFWYTQKLDFTT